MKPLKQLPIQSLPFLGIEQISKEVHSITKVISSRRCNEFPILRLPFLAIEEIFKTMHPIEIKKINFSMISKRTRTVAKLMSFYSKYSIHLFVENFKLFIGLYGTNEMVACTYIMTSEEHMDGKIEEKEHKGYINRRVYNYSKDPAEEWKQLCLHVLDIFKKKTIHYLSMQMDTYVNQNVSLIDFLKANVKSVNECRVNQWYPENNVDENFAYFLNNITINNKLDSLLHTENYYFDGQIPKNLKELHIHNSEWIGYDKLLEIDCKSLFLGYDRISNEQWNLFIKKWIAMETHLNLERLQLKYRELDVFRDCVLYDIPHEVVHKGVKRTLISFLNRKAKISGGIDIRRIDGKTATFIAQYNVFIMSIH
ncbi:hypothetical protein CRE_30496 [Caenorhabditis remanei]|uniref:F-box domain-containing protein n=1 Tax=Caenorhabditis remanei TaxID=31234 RepID=E3NI69_CAERE|nr:hypothetical protein CRE_30496 [Caenorhabditis remanei]